MSINDTSYTIKVKTNFEVISKFEPKQSIFLDLQLLIIFVYPINNPQRNNSSFFTYGTKIKTSLAINNNVKAVQGTLLSNILN